MSALIMALWVLAAGAVVPFSGGEVVHGPGEERIALGIAERAVATRQKLEKEFSLPAGDPIKIILTSSKKEFMAAQPIPGRAPDWADGTAWPEHNLIVLKSKKAAPWLEPKRVLDHELAHLVLERIFGDRRVPVWLNEGLVMHLSEEWGFGRQVAMARAVSSNSVIPLKELAKGFPEERIGAETAYAQSFYFLAFLRDRYGGRVVGKLVESMGKGHSFESAIYQITGSTITLLEYDFHDWLDSRFSIFWILTSPSMLWPLAAFLLLGAALWKRRRSARILAEWERQENESENDSDRT